MSQNAIKRPTQAIMYYMYILARCQKKSCYCAPISGGLCSVEHAKSKLCENLPLYRKRFEKAGMSQAKTFNSSIKDSLLSELSHH